MATFHAGFRLSSCQEAPTSIVLLSRDVVSPSTLERGSVFRRKWGRPKPAREPAVGVARASNLGRVDQLAATGGRRSPAPLSGAVCRAGATDRGASSGAARGRRSIRTGLDLRPALAGRGPEAVLTHLLGDQRFELPVRPRSTSPCSTGCLIRARTGQRSAGGRTCGWRRRSRSSSTPSTVPCPGWGRPGRP